MQDTKHLAFLMTPAHATDATEGSRTARGRVGGGIKKAPAGAGASRGSSQEGFGGGHGSGRLGWLDFGNLRSRQAGKAVNLIEAQAYTLGGCVVDQLLGSFGGHGLAFFVVADIRLGASDAIPKGCLSDAQQLADGFDLIHGDILAALVVAVNSGACLK